MPVISVSQRRALAAALLLALALVVGGRYAAGAGTPSREVELATVAATGATAAAAPPQIVVHVVGAVRQPGLYRLDDGSRVADAVARAGGATERADLAGVNLASPLADGLQVVVPERAAVAAVAGGAVAAPPPPIVHLNSATVEELDALPGIGPATAQKIVEHRERHGAFRSIDELDAVPGIGPARLEELRELVAP